MMSLRRIACKCRTLLSVRRMSANAGPPLKLDVDNEGFTVLTMQKAPVNSMSLEFNMEFCKTLDQLEQEKPKGVVLTSSLPTVFSAGLDFTELYKPDRQRLTAFHSSVLQLWNKLYRCSFPIAAAVNGHAPAGGCLLALGCEYRVMVQGPYTTGLNETALGLALPGYLYNALQHTIGSRQAEVAAVTSKLFSVNEALRVGLIDEIATNKEEAIVKCKAFLRRFDSISPIARALTKQVIRGNRDTITDDKEAFLDVLLSTETQQKLETVVNSFKRKSSKLNGN